MSRVFLRGILLVLLAAPAAAKPKDFDAFWTETKGELAAIPLEPKVVPDLAHTDKDVWCFEASFVSLYHRVVHARYCRPLLPGRYPAVVISPWYGQDKVDAPVALAKAGIAALAFQGRGFDVDQSTYPQENYWYILSGIGSRETYVYRELVAHSMRGLDFLAWRTEVDPNRLAVMGASQGGGLSLLVAGLDPRVRAVAADFPFLSDWAHSLKAPNSPYADVRKYLAGHPQERESVLETVSYFDALDVADRIKAPVLVQVGLKDRTCPPGGIKRVYAQIASKSKELKQYPKADHNNENAARWDSMTAWTIRALTAP